jgi:cysteine desulfuration protein SufE
MELADLDTETLLANFEILDDWTERYRYLIELGRKLPPINDATKQSENLVRGCQSQVWMTSELTADEPPRLVIHADSDAFIVKGLVAILLVLFSGKTPREALQNDARPVFEKLGLEQHLSPNRNNGLHAMVRRIKELALQHEGSNIT